MAAAGAGAGAGAGGGQSGDSSDDDAGRETQADRDFVDRDGDDPDLLAEFDQPQHFDQSQRQEEAEEHAPVDEDEALFNRVLKTGTKKRTIKLSEEEIEERAKALFAKMQEAAERDDAALRAGKPALHKLRMLKEVDLVLRNKSWHPIMLDNFLLRELGRWLQPSASRRATLPNHVVRTTLLNRLLELPVETGNLRESSIGKICMALFRHPKETLENKAVLRQIIDKWARLIFEKKDSFKHYARHSAPVAAGSRPVRAAATASSARRKKASLADAISGKTGEGGEEGEKRFSLHARIPSQETFDFVRSAKSQVDPGRKSRAPDSKSARQKLKRNLQELRRPVRKNVRAVQVSVDGRT